MSMHVRLHVRACIFIRVMADIDASTVPVSTAVSEIQTCLKTYSYYQLKTEIILSVHHT